MATSSRYTDVDFDFNANPLSDDVSKKVDGNAIKQSIKNLILMHRYDVPFHPDVASQIYSMLFELSTPLTIASLQRAITYTIENFEPRVELLDVQVVSLDEKNQLDITIVYVIKNVGTTQQFTFSVNRTR